MRFIQYVGIGVLTLAGVNIANIAHGAPGAGVELDSLMLAPVVPQAIPVTVPASVLDWLPPATLESTPSGLAATEAGGLGEAMEPARLENVRGGTETLVINEAGLSGLVSGNSATDVSSGANTITGAAFANASGIPVVIQNSGANVLIQNSTIVNLQLK
jgi:hypothetical protein